MVQVLQFVRLKNKSANNKLNGNMILSTQFQVLADSLIESNYLFLLDMYHRLIIIMVIMSSSD